MPCSSAPTSKVISNPCPSLWFALSAWHVTPIRVGPQCGCKPCLCKSLRERVCLPLFVDPSTHNSSFCRSPYNVVMCCCFAWSAPPAQPTTRKYVTKVFQIHLPAKLRPPVKICIFSVNCWRSALLWQRKNTASFLIWLGPEEGYLHDTVICVQGYARQLSVLVAIAAGRVAGKFSRNDSGRQCS